MITYNTLRGNESENRTYRNSWKWTWSKWTCFLQGNEQPKRSWKRNWKNSGVTGNRTLTFALTGLNSILYKWCNIRMNHFLFCLFVCFFVTSSNESYVTSMDRALRSVIAKVRLRFPVKPDFFFSGSFLTAYLCSFHCYDHALFQIFIRSSKYDWLAVQFPVVCYTPVFSVDTQRTVCGD